MKKQMKRASMLLMLVCAVLFWGGAVKAYADSIPADACQEEGYKPYEDETEYGCGVDGHYFYENKDDGYCTEDRYDYYYCANCDTYYYVKIPAGEHTYVETKVNATCTSAGSIKYECTSCDYSYSDSVPKLGHKYKITYTKASATKQTWGYKYKECSRCGDSYQDSSWPYPYRMELSYDTATSNGKAKKPKVNVYDYYGEKIGSSNYTVTYSNNVDPGKAKVTVKFKGKKYSGSLKTNFLILPKKVSSISVSYQSDAKMKVKWKKVTGAGGYAVLYSTSSKFPDDGRTCVKFFKKDKKSAVIPYMAKKKYYVKVAAYITVNSTKYCGKYSDKKNVTIKSGASMTSMLSHLKSTTANRDVILNLTDNGVDIKKYSSTISRIKAIYTWHAKNSGRFAHCLACNDNFNECIYYLINEKKFDNWIRMGCDRYKNNSGSIVQHKWSILFLQGVPYIFDPRMQGNIGNPTGFTYFGITSSSTAGKHYLFDGYYY